MRRRERADARGQGRDPLKDQTRAHRRVVATLIALATAVGLAVVVAPAAAGAETLPVPFGPAPVRLATVTPETGGPHEPGSAVLGDRLFFSGDAAGHGYEPWVTDGTPAGTHLLKDLQPGTGDESDPRDFVTFQGMVWFAATAPGVGREWWVSDGTETGTQLFADLNPGGSLSPRDPVVVDGRMYFSGYQAATGRELWVTDGTEAGTHLVKDLTRDAAESISPGELTRLGSRVVFSGQFAAGIRKLYISDGTAAGTGRLDATPGAVDLDPSFLTAFGDQVLFGGKVSLETGRELWSTRGEPGDPALVKDTWPGVGSSIPRGFTAVGSKLFFFASDPDNDRQLWSSDGTDGGTQVVRVIGSGDSPDARELTRVGNLVYFNVDDDVHGVEPWRSDGTESGTAMVRDLNPGLGSSAPRPLAAIGGHYVFAAFTGSGYDPWLSDGSAAGTRLIADSAPGGEDLFPTTVGVLGSTVVFQAKVDRVTGVYAYTYTVLASATNAHPKRRYKKRAARHRRIVVPVQVTSSTSFPPSGTVTFTRGTRGTRVVGRGTVVAGQARVRITARLAPGRHRIRVSYAGSVDVHGSTSTFVIRVRRR